MKYIVLIISSAISILCDAQSSTLFNQPDIEGKFYIVIADNNSYNKLKNDIIEYTLNEQEKSFLLFKAEDLSLVSIKNEINHMLNENHKIPKKYIYLIIAGDTNFLKRNSTIKSRIITSTLYLHTDEKTSLFEGLITEKYPSDKTFPELVNKLKGYTWASTVFDIRNKSVIDLNSGVQGTSFGLNIGNFLTGNNNYKTYLPNNFLTYGFHIIQPVTPKFQIKFDANFGVKIPNPESEIQEQIQSQVDFSVLMSGDDIEEEVTIGTQIKGHIYTNLSLSLQYFPLKAKRISPYIGFGISYSNLTSFSAQFDTTMVIKIDASSYSVGDGFGDFDQSTFRDDEGNDLNSTKYKSFEIPLSLGAYFKLSNRVKFSLNSTCQISLNNFNGNNYLNHFTVNLGLAIQFKRKNLFYQYIK